MSEGDPEPIVARIADGVGSLDAAGWDACVGDDNPFLRHAFLSILEESGSVSSETGWQPIPVSIEGADGRLDAVAPAYVKGHSQGEYVFDHAWADAWERAGGRYYPKLQVAVPFTPVPGRRLLARDSGRIPALIAALETITRDNDLSSAHATFIAEDEIVWFENAGWLIRAGSQFHWENDGYADFDAFLDALSSRKRKAIRKERRRAVEGLEIEHVTGADLSEDHWDIFWDFYQDTGMRKWGRPYLTRSFFSLLGERMGGQTLLILARRDGEPIAGALNLIGADTLYGRYWGCLADVPFLHFELCYYQAIDAAIARGLQRVEAGAQGSHKLARGYRPVRTWSAHYFPDPGFRRAVADFLTAERHAVEREIEFLGEMTPFRKAD
ncbi:N-acetyltransferase [Parasphingopyxis algicola]|uniref:GNAT family N-acetyltransferase n=1 Tax=Parasphingopyxis algicola TaxID=2026624 RepID=UPI0015A202D1|nr:GNAT family N-acetyltransferase [Parasphingopyxis algicola]QLC25294.1 N-acetyltransferase [Parasphingopyxis algicola]